MNLHDVSGDGMPLWRKRLFTLLPGEFLYACTEGQKGGWGLQTYPASERVKQTTHSMDSLRYPIPFVRKPATPEGAHRQSNLYAGGFGLTTPRNAPPVGGSNYPPPWDLLTLYSAGSPEVDVRWKDPLLAGRGRLDIARLRLNATLTASKVWVGKRVKEVRLSCRRTVAIYDLAGFKESAEWGAPNGVSTGRFRLRRFQDGLAPELGWIDLSEIVRGILRLAMQTCVVPKHQSGWEQSMERLRRESPSEVPRNTVLGPTVSMASEVKEVIILNEKPPKKKR